MRKVLLSFEVLVVGIAFSFICLWVTSSVSEALAPKYAKETDVIDALMTIKEQQERLTATDVLIVGKLKELQDKGYLEKPKDETVK